MRKKYYKKGRRRCRRINGFREEGGKEKQQKIKTKKAVLGWQLKSFIVWGGEK